MELITPTTAEVLATYDHPEWNTYAAVTRNQYGEGTATYIGCMTSPQALRSILEATLKHVGLWDKEQELEFPIITKKGFNDEGKLIRYYFNYSGTSQSLQYPYESGTELLTGEAVSLGQQITLDPWGFVIIEQ
ncbi:Beta-galactosidase LacA [compost metagenome]